MEERHRKNSLQETDVTKFSFLFTDFYIPCSEFEKLVFEKNFQFFEKQFRCRGGIYTNQSRDKMFAEKDIHTLCVDSYLSPFFPRSNYRGSDSIFFPQRVGGGARVSRYFIRVHSRIHRLFPSRPTWIDHP